MRPAPTNWSKIKTVVAVFLRGSPQGLSFLFSEGVFELKFGRSGGSFLRRRRVLAAIQAAKIVSATALKGLLASPCKAKPQSPFVAFIFAPPANATACTSNHSRERIALNKYLHSGRNSTNSPRVLNSRRVGCKLIFLFVPPANATACTNNHSRERIAVTLPAQPIEPIPHSRM